MKKLLSVLLAVVFMLSMMAFAQVTDPAANEVGVSPIVKEGEQITLTWGLKQNANVTDYYDNDFTRLLEERLGVKIDFVLFPASDAEAKLDLMVTSGEPLPDIITFGITDNVRRYNYGKAGAIIATDELFEELGEPLRVFCAENGIDLNLCMEQLRSPDGKLYVAAINRDENYANMPMPRAWINTTWLEALDLEMPTTSEELYDVLVAFRDGDPNGNGIQDEIPMMGCDKGWHGSVINYLQDMFIYYAHDGSYRLPLSETNGEIDVAYDKDEYRQALIYMNKLVSEGLLSTLSFTQDKSQLDTYMLTEPSQVGIYVMGVINNLMKINDKYDVLEVCAGPEGVQWQSRQFANAQASCAISSACEHPEIAFMALEYMYYSYVGGDKDSMDIFYANHWGVRGRDWDYAAPGTQGMFSEYGYDAAIEIKNIVWGELNNVNWKFTALANLLFTAPMIMEAFDGDLKNPEYWYAKNYGVNSKYMPANEDLVPALTYTEEETHDWADTMTALNTYVNEARTLFVIGQLDPNSDEDWNNYLNELNELNYKEVIAVDQKAFERIKK